MNWTDGFIDSIKYIEDNLLTDLKIEDIANKAALSPFYFQKAFSIYTNYSVGEYIRNRRLYLAALELQSSDIKIIDLAYKYKYETPESFTKAFTRFHGYTPSQIRKGEGLIKLYLPLKIKVSISGGNDMEYIVEKETNLKFIGFKKHIKEGEGYKECPKFWDEIYQNYFSKLNDNSDISNAIKKYCVGAFAICVNNEDGDGFDYYICGKYEDGEIPEGMEIISLKDSLWAKFPCIGPLPGALQSVNTKIWKEWIPNNDMYTLNANVDIEYYTDGDTSASDYRSEIWLPVDKK